MAEPGYSREVLVETLVYHQRRADSGCHCGWGSRPEHLGRSWAEHVAEVYEQAAGWREGAARGTPRPQEGGAGDEPPDVVIPVRASDRNEELRYALRSLRFLPHRRVWLAGHCPPWVKGVGHVPNPQTRSKYENSTANLVAACQHEDVSEEFVLWNDDIFLLERIERVPAMNRGRVADVAAYYQRYASGTYYQGMRLTARILHDLGHPDPLSYELHVPMPMRKSLFLDAIKRATAPGMPRFQALHKRTLYGNLVGLGGETVEDVKVHVKGERTWTPGPVPFVSTTELIFREHPAGKYVRDLHFERSQYERGW